MIPDGEDGSDVFASRRASRPLHRGAGLPRAVQALIIVLVSVPAAVFGVHIGLSVQSGGLDHPIVDALATGLPGLTVDPPAVTAQPAEPSGQSPTPDPARTPVRSPSHGPTAPPTSAGPPPFVPVAVQAEDPGNTLDGVGIAACPTCDGGARVRYIGGTSSLTVNVSITAGGLRTLTIVYECVGSRLLKVSIAGRAPINIMVSGTVDWDTPLVLTFKADVPAGNIGIKFYNEEPGGSPDIDKVTIA